MSLPITPSDEQSDIIFAARGHALVDAGAGIGKSTTLALRGAHLIRDLGVPSEAVFALSFSRLSATDLAERFLREVEGKEGAAAAGMIDSPVGTFHSVFLRQLKSHRHVYRKFEVENETSRRLLVRRYYRWLNVDAAVGDTGTNALSGAGRISAQAAARTERLRRAQNITLFLNLIDRVREECVPSALLPPALRDGLEHYQRLLRAKAIWDHSQLLTDFLEELTPDDHLSINEENDGGRNRDRGALRAHLSSTLREVLADEAQDCNRLLWHILGRLRDIGANVWCIGDLDQLLYPWRGADIQAFSRFSSEYPQVRRFVLKGNYRSSSGVLALASDFIDGVGLVGRDAKRLTAEGHHQWEKGDIAVCRFAAPEQQCEWVAKRIKAMIGTPIRDKAGMALRGMVASDFAVIFRRRDSTAGIAAALRAEGLEPAVRSEHDLLVPLEAQALAVAVFHMAGKARDEEVRSAFLAADIGLEPMAIEQAISVLQTIRECADGERAERLRRQGETEKPHGETAQRSNGEISGPVCLIRVLQAVFGGAAGFSEEHIRAAAPHRSADAVMLNVSRIFKAVGDYQRWHYRDPLDVKLVGLADWLRDEAESDCRRGDGNPEDGSGASTIPLMTAPSDAVTLTTCHSCKGLQWAAVFVVDVAEGWLPVPPRVDKRFWSALPRGSGIIQNPERYDGSFDDEARLLYVSLTRAAKFLSVTYAPLFEPPRAWTRAGGARKRNPKPAAPSRYLSALENHWAAITDPDLLPSATATALSDGTMLPPEPLKERRAITLTFSQLFYYFLCPYQFKMRFVYGFVPPISPFLGYPKSLHDAAAELEKRAAAGETMVGEAFYELAARHLRMPFATVAERENRVVAAAEALAEYARCYRVNERGGDVQFIEREVRLDLGDLVILGRIDRSYFAENGTLRIDELKTTHEAVDRDTELIQLQTYAAAYQDTVGVLPHKVGVRLIGISDPDDDSGLSGKEPAVVGQRIELNVHPMDEEKAQAVRARLNKVGEALARGAFPAHPAKSAGSDDYLATCRNRCDVRRLCGWYKRQLSSRPTDFNKE